MNDKTTKIFSGQGLIFGRMVGASKGQYSKAHPDNEIIFNARIYDKKTYDKQKDKKIKDFFEGQNIELWYGDLDLNKDIKKLRKVANQLGTLIITTEHGQKMYEITKEE